MGVNYSLDNMLKLRGHRKLKKQIMMYHIIPNKFFHSSILNPVSILNLKLLRVIRFNTSAFIGSIIYT